MELTSREYKLEEEKLKVINEYRLYLNSNLNWEYRHPKNKYQTVEYFSQKFASKHTALAMVFQIHKLCFAKIKYFEKNIEKYEPYKYELLKGFCKCDMYDMEFLKHKPSNSMIDIRSLRNIKNIDEFKEFCLKLESLE